MTPSDKLFQLIKSLSKSEKRNFKLLASLNDKEEKSVFLKLFDAIEKQTRRQGKYDEKAIKEQFKKEVFIKQLTAAKFHLLNLILKSLRNYYNNTSANEQANKLLLNLEILFKKG